MARARSREISRQGSRKVERKSRMSAVIDRIDAMYFLALLSGMLIISNA